MAPSFRADQNDSQELIDSIVPEQLEGGESNVDIPFTCSSPDTANAVFANLKMLLVNVNQWHRHVKGVTARFQVTDKNGRPVQEEPTPGDHFKIRIPGPTLQSGNGYDWITVAEKREKENGNAKMFYLTAVPSRNPTNDRPEVAHFLQNCASTTFIAFKQDRIVRMLIKSRNEVPNTQVGNWHDRMRNRMVGFFAAIYLSQFQWTRLTKSLLHVAIQSGESGRSGVDLNVAE